MSSTTHKYEAPMKDFLATVPPKLCLQVELKNSETGKNKILGYFVVKAIRTQDVP